ncbi:MAG: CrcB family protein [Deltaproteobacteria bacterium]|nr:CrcB family protein [Deltaproteobacteria bacterium]
MLNPSFVKVGLVILGGAIGTGARYYVSSVAYHHLGARFPWGTMIVNLVGCLLIGLLWGFLEDVFVSTTLKAFLFLGILGGFTTYSSFAMESFNLFRSDIKLAFINILISNGAGILLTAVGYGLSLFVRREI